MNSGSWGPVFAALQRSHALLAVSAATVLLPLAAAQAGHSLLTRPSPPGLSARTLDRLAVVDLGLRPPQSPSAHVLNLRIPLPTVIAKPQPRLDLRAALTRTDIPAQHRSLQEAQLGHLVYGSEQPGLFWVLVASDPSGIPTVWIVDADSGLAFKPFREGGART